MYIWILLAAIMVALSFFNLSPRPDKDHSVNEIKAATVVNRFKSEHLAMFRYMECEIVKQTDNSNWDGEPVSRTSANGPVEIKVKYADDTITASPKLAYTKFSCGLPPGYKPGHAVQVKHFIYCLNGAAEADKADDGSGITFKACDQTSYRYLVSYAYIPDRWLSHERDGKPAPLFMSFLSKPTSGGSTYGWTDCANGKCTLRGYSSKTGRYRRDEQNVQMYEYTLLADDSVLWSKAAGDCGSKPCLFAYLRLPVDDTANHCYNLQQKQDDKCDNEAAEETPEQE